MVGWVGCLSNLGTSSEDPEFFGFPESWSVMLGVKNTLVTDAQRAFYPVVGRAGSVSILDGSPATSEDPPSAPLPLPPPPPPAAMSVAANDCSRPLPLTLKSEDI